jgi:hypothetical protein
MGSLAMIAVMAACGGRAPGGAPAPEPGRPPLIVREVPPDPVPTLAAVCSNDVTVADARPVSATTVGHYYLENGGLVYLVLVRGAPGWYGDLKDWQVPPPTLGQHVRNAEIAGFRYALDLDIGERKLSILDKEVDLEKTNVVFLDRVGNTLSIVGGELMNLCWSSPPDAVGQVLSRSPAATRFVMGTPPPSRRQAPARRTRR